jgi:hypothetical protein
MRGMVIDMNDEQLSTLGQLRAFVEGTVPKDFTVAVRGYSDLVASVLTSRLGISHHNTIKREFSRRHNCLLFWPVFW